MLHFFQLTDETAITDVNNTLKVAADIEKGDLVRIILEKTDNPGTLIARNVILPLNSS